jgi:hypothetical protein
MGTFVKGVLGGFKGKVGSVIGTKWKGLSVMRSKAAPRSKGSASEKQLEQQARFAFSMNFLLPLGTLLNQTFDRHTKGGMTGFNKAFAYNIVQAISGVSPNFQINFGAIQLSRGMVPMVITPASSSPAAGQLVFTWKDFPNSSNSNSRLSSDSIYVAAYNPDLNHWVYVLDIAQRSAGTATVDVTGFSGKILHTYLGIISSDGNTTSNSAYLGAVTVL